jgi:hypothetical protein
MAAVMLPVAPVTAYAAVTLDDATHVQIEEWVKEVGPDEDVGISSAREECGECQTLGEMKLPTVHAQAVRGVVAGPPSTGAVADEQAALILKGMREQKRKTVKYHDDDPDFVDKELEGPTEGTYDKDEEWLPKKSQQLTASTSGKMVDPKNNRTKKQPNATLPPTAPPPPYRVNAEPFIVVPLSPDMTGWPPLPILLLPSNRPVPVQHTPPLAPLAPPHATADPPRALCWDYVTQEDLNRIMCQLPIIEMPTVRKQVDPVITEWVEYYTKEFGPLCDPNKVKMGMKPHAAWKIGIVESILMLLMRTRTVDNRAEGVFVVEPDLLDDETTTGVTRFLRPGRCFNAKDPLFLFLFFREVGIVRLNSKSRGTKGMVQWLAACGLGPPADAVAWSARGHRGPASTDPDKKGQHPSGPHPTNKEDCERNGLYYIRYESCKKRVCAQRRIFNGDD